MKGGGKYKAQVNFEKNEQIVIQHAGGRFLRIKPGNHGKAGSNGGTGRFARWNLITSNNNTIKLQSNVSGAFLRISKKVKLNVMGGGGKWTKFLWKRNDKDNSVTLQSCEHNGKFVGIDPKSGLVSIFDGGEECKLWFWKEGKPEIEKVAKAEEEEEEEEEPEIEDAESEEEQEEESSGDESDSDEDDEIVTHSQPFPNAVAGIKKNAEFNAEEQAKKLRSAMKGIGTNETKLIEVTTAYNHKQRMVIRNKYESEYDRNLYDDLESECKGKFEKLICGLWMKDGEYNSYLVEEAVSGIGFDTNQLNDCICTITNSEIELMKKAWKKDESLNDRVNSETKKLIGSDNYYTLIDNILNLKRNANGEINEELAKKDAEMLNRYLEKEDESKAKGKFVDIFSTRSWTQIRGISNVFDEISEKYTLLGAIEKTFGDSSDTAKGLKTIIEFACTPYEFWAKKLLKSMDGVGTDSEAMRRVICSRADIDLKSIAIAFSKLDSADNKTLRDWIKGESGGDYEDLCLACCGYSD